VYGRVTGVTVVGVRGHVVAVEAHIGRGLPSLTLTGLPGAPVQDARDRIRPAVESAGLEWLEKGDGTPAHDLALLQRMYA